MATVEECAQLECMLMDVYELADRLMETAKALNTLIATLQSMVDEKITTPRITHDRGEV